MPRADSARKIHEPGTVLGDYAIDTPIGRGGFARVYRARQLSTNREVALKVLFADRGEDRFAREAEALRALAHRNIVEVIDYGVDDGWPYLALELLEGETLADRLRAGVPLPLEEAAWVVAETLAGLDAAHGAGVIHRDIKPSNILLVEQHGRLAVKVIDFGVSHLAGASRLTETGALVGTPAYASPELVGAEPHDHRTDLWSIGVVFYESVVGERPFEGTLVELIAQILGPPPSLERTPPAIRGVLARALAPVATRAASAAELRALLYGAVDPRAPILPRKPRTVAGDTIVEPLVPTMARPRPPSAAPPPLATAVLPTTQSRAAPPLPPSAPNRQAWIVGAAAATTVVLLGLCSMTGGALLWREDPTTPATPGETPPLDPDPLLQPAWRPEHADTPCARAYRCCRNVVDGQGREDDNHIRCITRTQPEDGSCDPAETRWCQPSAASGPCRDYYDCCIRIREDAQLDSGECGDVLALQPRACADIMRSDWGQYCYSQYGIGVE